MQCRRDQPCVVRGHTPSTVGLGCSHGVPVDWISSSVFSDSVFIFLGGKPGHIECSNLHSSHPACVLSFQVLDGCRISSFYIVLPHPF
jgi:hypothetical protein